MYERSERIRVNLEDLSAGTTLNYPTFAVRGQLTVVVWAEKNDGSSFYSDTP
jgi:hypothetical protein